MLTFKKLCPNCWNDISWERAEKWFVCKQCYWEIIEWDLPWTKLDDKYLKQLKNYKQVLDKTNQFVNFFQEKLNQKPWSLQISWTKRIFLNENFSITAPTWVGKTTWWILTSLFLAKEWKKTYFILPTSLLVKQVYDNFTKYDKNVKILAYHSKLKTKEKTLTKEKIKDWDFDILITTSLFLQKNFEFVNNKHFDFIFVDDVDSILKRSKALDKLLYLMWFSDDDLKLALEKYKIKLKLTQNKKLTPQEEEILQKEIKKTGTILVVSSATIKPRWIKPKILSVLLNFEIGKASSNLRNVIDFYTEENNFKKFLVEHIKKLKNGILIFTSEDYWKEKVEELKNFLLKQNIQAASYQEIDEETIEKFKSWEIQVLIWIASWRNPLARWIDIPLASKYAFFYGVPKFIFSFNNNNPKLLLSILFLLKNNLNDTIEAQLEEKLNQLLNYIPYLRKISFSTDKTKQILDQIKSFCQISQVKKVLENLEDISFDGEKFILADVASYIQASGRVSRLYLNKLTTWLSCILVDNKKAFNDLKKKLKISYDINLLPYKEQDFYELVQQIEKERQELKQAKIKNTQSIKIVSSLMIVESPNKARTIANFFWNSSKRQIGPLIVYEFSLPSKVVNITASVGHILDLITKEGTWWVIRENVKNYTMLYGAIKTCLAKFNENELIQVVDEIEKCNKIYLDKYETIKSLRKIAFETDEILLATDPDIEWEKIAYDLFCNLRAFNSNIKRVYYHEVTKKAILEAINNPTSINQNLVNAQITRRVADRWIWFALSEKLQNNFNNTNYSAWRVQTPVLGWILEKTEKLKNKKNVIFLKILDYNLNFDLQQNLSPKSGKLDFKIQKASSQEEQVNPSAPFTTDKLLHAWWNQLRFSAQKVMKLAQELFETWLITYHRTDSTHISDKWIQIAKDYLLEKNLLDYFYPRSWWMEWTHEAIRLTKPWDKDILLEQINLWFVPYLSKDHIKLYELIFNHFLASQSKSAKIIKATFSLTNEQNNLNFELELPYQIIKNWFNIFEKIEKLELGEYLNNQSQIQVDYLIKKIPIETPYTQWTLIQKMKESKLWRPSTYAIIVSTLFKRKYIREIPKTGWLIATKKWKLVYEFLNSLYPELISEQFTRYLEEKLDSIEKWENFQAIIEEIYQKLKGEKLL